VDDAKELACVLIPLADTHLLLPNVTIAEILPWRRIAVGRWSEMVSRSARLARRTVPVFSSKR
jgi:hypothetical protein